uniref:Uncharacterized protein n=1 Tax=Arundo donax TaxID=35708 RepID=A0A0A9GEC0_ARUDO
MLCRTMPLGCRHARARAMAAGLSSSTRGRCAGLQSTATQLPRGLRHDSPAAPPNVTTSLVAGAVARAWRRGGLEVTPMHRGGLGATARPREGLQEMARRRQGLGAPARRHQRLEACARRHGGLQGMAARRRWHGGAEGGCVLGRGPEEDEARVGRRRRQVRADLDLARLGGQRRVQEQRAQRRP